MSHAMRRLPHARRLFYNLRSGVEYYIDVVPVSVCVRATIKACCNRSHQ